MKVKLRYRELVLKVELSPGLVKFVAAGIVALQAIL